MLIACAGLIVAVRKTVARGPGAAAALRPQVRVPPAARSLLPAAAATFVATWALGGFYQAFGPSVAAEQLGTTNTLIVAVIFASLMAPSAIGAPLAGRTTPAGAQRIGIVVFCAAVVVIPLSMQLSAIEKRDEAARVHSAPVHGTERSALRPSGVALSGERSSEVPTP